MTEDSKTGVEEAADRRNAQSEAHGTRHDAREFVSDPSRKRPAGGAGPADEPPADRNRKGA
ncbi:hypothetical protein [Celeribacter indicus]|uniref:Uncharacterized protein n=1 Tax=Celeribacter indicus TaxID=1208324 RepID=A0A0B5E0S2_9RHOB|nr:hypothetical protein [Celeribacter indicus]AJE48874.1 hypothetical protein P73_4159 [Celeribacter indicus]SDW39861.1 hypothetical protein SAMN05443573_10381 [Celeribacter indicus]